MTKYLLNGMGYYSDISVGIHTYSYTPGFKRENLSDIDVFGVQFEHDLTPREVVVECKSTDEHALEEVFKLKGIMEWKRATRAMLVKHRIASNAREVGHKLGVRTLDATELSTLVENLGLMKPSLLPGLLSNHRKRQRTLLLAKQQFTKAVTYLTTEYWNVDHNRNIQSIMTMLVQLGPKLDLVDESHLFLFLEAVKLLSMSILHMGSEIIGTGLANPGPRLRDYLFGGARERREREILFDRINQQLGLDTPFYPHYTGDLEELTLWILRSPGEARRIPLCLDHILNSTALALPGYPLGTVESGYGRVTLKLSKDILAFAVKASGVASQPFRQIMQL